MRGVSDDGFPWDGELTTTNRERFTFALVCPCGARFLVTGGDSTHEILASAREAQFQRDQHALECGR